MFEGLGGAVGRKDAGGQGLFWGCDAEVSGWKTHGSLGLRLGVTYPGLKPRLRLGVTARAEAEATVGG